MHFPKISLRLSLVIALSMGISASSFGVGVEFEEAVKPNAPTKLHLKAYATLVKDLKNSRLTPNKTYFELAVMAEQAGVPLKDKSTLFFYVETAKKNGFSLENPMTATHFKAADTLKRISQDSYSNLRPEKQYFELALMAEQAGVVLKSRSTLFFYVSVAQENGFSLENPMTATHFKAADTLKRIFNNTSCNLRPEKQYFELALMAGQARVPLESCSKLFFYVSAAQENGFSLENPMTATHFKAADTLEKISDRLSCNLRPQKKYFDKAYDAAQKDIEINTLQDLMTYHIR